MQNQKSINDLYDLRLEIRDWANEVYPDRTPYQALAKMVMEEIPELLKDGLDDPLEWADLLILVLDASELRGIDIIDAARVKMEINKRRSWEIDKESGIMHHVAGSGGDA